MLCYVCPQEWGAVFSGIQVPLLTSSLLSHSALVRSQCVQFCAVHYKRDMGILDRAQRRDTKVINLLSYERAKPGEDEAQAQSHQFT